MAEEFSLTELTAEIVSAYVGSTTVASGDIATLVKSVHAALAGVDEPAEPANTQQLATKSQIKNSVGPDFLTSFEDGGHYKSLKRHLTTRGMTPDEYRTKWGLPKDYPMVSQSYSAQRSELAKKLGLGNKRTPETTHPAPSAPVAAHGRKPKIAAKGGSQTAVAGAAKRGRKPGSGKSSQG